VVACAHPQAPPRPTQQPELRIGLVTGAPQVTVGGSGRVSAFADGAAQLQLDNRQVTLTVDGRALSVPGNATRYERLILTSLDPGGFVSVGGHSYRGTVELFVQGGGITAVNRVLIEDYLAGVVSAEMGHRAANEQAALAAQSVVSRTYALKNRGRYAAQGYDLTAGVADQAYGGVDAETPEGTAAVRATTGLVLTYDGQLILAFFHSTCGYATATPSEAFRGIANVPYLRSVSDRKPGGGYYCDISPRFRWRVEWDGTTLRDILRRTLPNVLGIAAEQVDQLRDVRVAHTGPSGRAVEIRVRVGGGEIPVFGPDIRSVFQTPEGRPLGSTAIQLHPEYQADTLARLVAAGAGWGHGVGLCQWGAVGRARAGQSYDQILSAYFPGTKIERWY
jgi:stage II sporulation protein D (peptidoglycan lytic transglycosylase)